MEPIRHGFHVDLLYDDAFRLFTRGMGSWWDPDLTPDPQVFSGIEVGEAPGQPVTMLLGEDRYEFGEIVRFDEGWRYAQTFWLNMDPAHPTEIEVEFVFDGIGTRVDLEHRGWDENNAQFKAGFSWWPTLLKRYADAADQQAASAAEAGNHDADPAVPDLRPVQTRRDEVRQQWEDSEGEFVLLGFEPAPGHAATDPELHRDVAELVGATNEATAQRWPIYGSADEPVMTPQGPAIALTVYDGEALDAWMDSFVDGLSKRGYGGVLTTHRQDYPDMRRSSLRPLPCVTAVLGLSGWTFRSNRDRPQTRGAWASDPVLAGELADWALGWVTSGELVTGSEVFLCASGVAMKVDARSAQDLLSSALGRARADAEIGAYAGVSEGRRIRFDTAGRLIVESRSTSRGWEEVVAELTDLVRANAARVDYAFIRQAWMFSLGLFDVSNRMPPRLPHHPGGTAPTGNFEGRQDRDESYVPDAHAIQLLTDSHLERAVDLTHWAHEEMEPGRHLVSAHHLKGWFAAPDLDPELVERARRDFRPLISMETDWTP